MTSRDIKGPIEEIATRKQVSKLDGPIIAVFLLFSLSPVQLLHLTTISGRVLER